MEQNQQTSQLYKEKNGQLVSRRQALKVLAAAGGALAVSSLLPEKWAKPEMEMGVLPAHAQSSVDCLLVGDISITASTTTLLNGEYTDFELYVVTPDNSIVCWGIPAHQGAQHYGDNIEPHPNLDSEVITITSPVSGIYQVKIFMLGWEFADLTVVIQSRGCTLTFQDTVGFNVTWCIANLNFPEGTVSACSNQSDQLLDKTATLK
jgi:hypothetical protein